MNCFSENYQTAREKFVQQIELSGGVLKSFCHPSEKGLLGEDLFIDAAFFGSPKAKKKIVFIGGVHGLEGLVASAVQLSWLKNGWLNKLDRDTSLVMVHGLNPWGMSHFRRTNENNVDLNRNFTDFPCSAENPHYPELHDLICTEEWSDQVTEEILQRTEKFAQKHGWPTLIDTLMRGQYTHPHGFEFGGNEQQWSSQTFIHIVSKMVLPAEKVLYIDWHTGLGDYGESFFVHHYDQDSKNEAALFRYFGEKIRSVSKGYVGGEKPLYNGVLGQYLERILLNHKSQCLGMVVEFGTKDNHSLKKSLLLDRWLNTSGKSIKKEQKAIYCQQLLQDFYPADSRWREMVMAESERLFAQILVAVDF